MSIITKIRNWFRPTVHVILRDSTTPITHKRAWTGEGSRIERDILYHLQYGPMTRRQLDDVLDVQTAAIVLPRMVERGLILKSGVKPFVYCATPKGLKHAQDSEVST